MMLDRDLLGAPELHAVHRGEPRRHRTLGGSNDQSGFQSLLVDKRGNEYDPYSLAWRYLGLYIDCDLDDADDEGYHGRRMPSDDEGGECERKVLWAAYVDPRYRGHAIEEYQFYDLASGEWDGSACRASGKRHRCARMDCHESHTHFKLVGVFKETDGMYDFTEQLFKHEGYCVWGNDGDGEDSTYETMETWMEKWPTSCTQLNNQDYYGNTLYIHVHPLPEGNMTLGIYTNDQCTSLSPEIDLTNYIETLYYNYYGDYERGSEVASMYAEAIATWNEKMSVFKICQPCRAYNLFSENDNGNSKDHRFLGSGDENDGEGEVQDRYNCYDDAGYTNVDQCYKFETKTSLEMADADDDLGLASAQGTILRIKAFGKNYGKGGYSSPMSTARLAANISFAVLAAICLAGMTIYLQRLLEERKRRDLPRDLKEALNTNAETGEGSSKNIDTTDASCCTSDSSKSFTDDEAGGSNRDDAGDYGGIEIGTISHTPSGQESAHNVNGGSGQAIPTSHHTLISNISDQTRPSGPTFTTDTTPLADLGLLDHTHKLPQEAPTVQTNANQNSTGRPRKGVSQMDTAVLLDLGLIKRSKMPPPTPLVVPTCLEPDAGNGAAISSASLETTTSLASAIDSPNLDTGPNQSLDVIHLDCGVSEEGHADIANSTPTTVPNDILRIDTCSSSDVEQVPSAIKDEPVQMEEASDSFDLVNKINEQSESAPGEESSGSITCTENEGKVTESCGEATNDEATNPAAIDMAATTEIIAGSIEADEDLIPTNSEVSSAESSSVQDGDSKCQATPVIDARESGDTAEMANEPMPNNAMASDNQPRDTSIDDSFVSNTISDELNVDG